LKATKPPKPQHLPVNIFAASHEMLKDWYLEPDSREPGKQVLIVRQIKLDGEEATVKCIRIPQDQWVGLIGELQKILDAEGNK
jgi:hypothetical protein